MLAKWKCSAQNLELKTRRHFGWGGNVAPCLVFVHLHLCKISLLYTFRAWKTSRHQSESEFLTFEKKKKMCRWGRERIRRHLLMKSKWSALIGSSINSHQCRIPVECEAHWVGSYLPSCRVSLLSWFIPCIVGQSSEAETRLPCLCQYGCESDVRALQ